MSRRSLIWLTRPESDSERMAEALKSHDIDSIIAPVLRIEQITPQLPAQLPNALLLTSRHAIHALNGLPKSLPVFCVGEATAAAIGVAGFCDVYHADEILDLLPLLTQAAPARVLYLSGEEIRIDVGTLLKPQGITVERILAYKAHAQTELPTALHAAMKQGEVGGVCFFSPRSANVAIELLKRAQFDKYTHTMDAFCLSLAVAEVAAGLDWRRIHACPKPTPSAMRDLVVSCAASVL